MITVIGCIFLAALGIAVGVFFNKLLSRIAAIEEKEMRRADSIQRVQMQISKLLEK